MQARVRQAHVFTVVAIVLVIVIGHTALAKGVNPHVGTWKLNLAKSKYRPGTALKSGTLKIEAVGAGVTVTADLVTADGTMRHYEYTAYYDGKDYPIIGNALSGDMVALSRINANTMRTVDKKGGKITTVNTSVVSSDGQTRTITGGGIDARGQTVNNVSVWDRQ